MTRQGFPTRRIATFAVFVASVAAVGCGGDDDDTERNAATSETAAKTPTAAQSGTTARGPLDGAYVASFTGKERSGADDTGPYPGRWTLRFEGPDASLTRPDGKTFALGPVVYSGGRLDFTGRENELCADRATFMYSRSGGVLAFRDVTDPCLARVTLLTKRTWKAQ